MAFWKTCCIIAWKIDLLKSLYLLSGSGGAVVLGKLPVPGRPTIRIIVGQRPIAVAVGSGGGLFGHFYSRQSFSLFLSLGEGPS